MYLCAFMILQRDPGIGRPAQTPQTGYPMVGTSHKGPGRGLWHKASVPTALGPNCCLLNRAPSNVASSASCGGRLLNARSSQQQAGAADQASPSQLAPLVKRVASSRCSLGSRVGYLFLEPSRQSKCPLPVQETLYYSAIPGPPEYVKQWPLG